MEEKPPIIKEKPISILNQEFSSSIGFYIEKIVFLHTKKIIIMRELSEEIGISQPTLSKFYNQKTKRLSDVAKEKLNRLYKR
ncbi:helix-turn-helix domain-containing protein [Bacillus thuringiensis]|nr:helix-turn-helix domain-containing protein [Bacillus thuringiensis]